MTRDDHWIATDGGTIFARQWRPPDRRDDSGAAILLFHDSLGSVEGWRDFGQQLARATGRRVVAYDRLGFGRSDPRQGRLPSTFIHDEAEQVVPCLRESLHIDSMIPFGHSVGGAMAVLTAARFPDRCVALVTESAQSFVENRTLAGIRAARFEFARAEQFERLARRHGAHAQWVLDAWIETWLDPSFASWSLDEELRRVSCPTLVLHGDRDEYGSVAHPERIAGLVTGPSRTVILEDCGHVPHREQPERMLRHVKEFLEGR
jgi:pimeloyl-ACP methyl ester carboxylesterase